MWNSTFKWYFDNDDVSQGGLRQCIGSVEASGAKGEEKENQRKSENCYILKQAKAKNSCANNKSRMWVARFVMLIEVYFEQKRKDCFEQKLL